VEGTDEEFAAPPSSPDEEVGMNRRVRFLLWGMAVSFALVAATAASGGGAKSTAAIPDFTPAQLSAPSGANWILENGNLQSWRYSTLNQITAANGGSLKLAWTTHLANPATADKVSGFGANANPIVYNGVAYVQDIWRRITALDAATGKTLWQFDPRVGLNTPECCGSNQRSLGMGDNMIFTGTSARPAATVGPPVSWSR
jgi:quinohemoprotein ethanol dehydrogenase